MKRLILICFVFVLMSKAVKGQYLPLTAGSGYPLTGDLYIDGTTGNRLIFSYGGVTNNKVLLGSTYSITGAGSQDDFAAYIRGNNPYSIWTNSLQRLIVDGNGNVGIGTTSPSTTLDVTGILHVATPDWSTFPGGEGAFIGWNKSGGGGETNFINNIGGGGTGGFAFDNTTNGSTFSRLLTILANGNNGIGTNRPWAALQIGNFGAASDTNQVLIPGVYNFEQMRLGQTGNGNLAMEFVNHTSSSNSYGVKMLVNVDSGSPGLQFQYAPSASSYVGLSYQTGLFMGIDGAVGIGTTTPHAKLEINDNNGTGELAYFGAEGIANANGIYLSRPSVNTNPVNIQGTSYIVGAANISLQAEGGNVAIGTSDPNGYKLAVNGDAIAISMTVKDHTDWPDYVFKPTYQLTPLSEIKTYIDKNQHLPDMPSAEQIEKNGQNLGEMNKLLTKKVEELTLYLIEQKEAADKQNELQQQQITEQAKKLQDLETRLLKLETKDN